jgi:hypothetical protein
LIIFTIKRTQDNIIKSNSIAAIGKLFGDDGAYDGIKVLNVCEAMDMPCTKEIKNAQVRL